MLRVLAGIEEGDEWNCGFFEGKWGFRFLFFGLEWLRDWRSNVQSGKGCLIPHDLYAQSRVLCRAEL